MRRRAALAFAVAVALHGAAAWLLPRAARSVRPTTARVQVAVRSVPPPSTPAPKAASPVAPQPPRRAPPPAAPPVDVVTPPVAAAPPVAEAPPAVTPPRVDDVTPPPAGFLDRVVAGTAPSLRPSTRALQGALDPEPPPGQRVIDQGATSVPDPHDDGPKHIVIVQGGVVRDVGDAVGELDGRKRGTKLGQGPATLTLVRHRDGTLRYRSGGFSAVIAKDGTVTFLDNPDLAPALGPFGGDGRAMPQQHGSGSLVNELMGTRVEDVPLPFASGTFDVDAPLQRAMGNDPFGAEKSCFLRDTQSLRDDLAQDDRALRHARGLYHLDQQLAALLVDPDRTPAEVKAAVVDLWDDCSDEGAGRAHVEEFVRVHMPRGGPFGFGVDELARLNAGRAVAFAPYG